MRHPFTKEDIDQINGHGLTVEKVDSQIENFKNGFGWLPIDRAATPGDGIIVPDKISIEKYINKYDREADSLQIVKFIPASGAATRMFKDIFEFADSGEHNKNSKKLVENIRDFAFCDSLDLGEDADGRKIARSVLDYGAQLPKALIYFHKYPDEIRTSLEEHLTEGAQYSSSDGTVRLHFTVSPEHRDGFQKLLDETLDKYEARHGVEYRIELSTQSPGTDTIAVTPDNEPFRTADGRLVFRPAGHGALIENLNRIDADIVFIKNIDNVTTDRNKPDTVIYKKALAGMLIELREKIFKLLDCLDKAGDAALTDAESFITNELKIKLPPNFESWGSTEKSDYLRKLLDRPVRICAMVENEGEPGGGPFWVDSADGSQSLQIAESSQIEDKKILEEGTHFNPVDIVCSVRGRNGKKYDLSKFVDRSTGFISDKSIGGKPLRALELPGLWNGSMADWTTLFVEVPVSTFTPVKVVTDLLRPEHR